jgi:hypothetical protein
MIRTVLKVAVADIILVVAEFLVLQDLQWRTDYAASLHSACPQLCRYSPSFGYSVLTRFFTMAGNGTSLTSPATLDWAQLLALLLLAINAFYAYDYLRKRRNVPKGA